MELYCIERDGDRLGEDGAGASRAGRGAGPLLRRDRLRQCPRHPSGGAGEVPPHKHKLFRHFARSRGLPRRIGRYAALGDPRSVLPQLVLRYGLVRHLALPRRPLQHRQHPEPVRDIARSVLGDHGPVHVPDADEPPEGGSPHCRCLGVLRDHLVSCDRLVAGRPGERTAPVDLPLHRKLRLLDVLEHNFLLPPAVCDGVYLLSDLQGRRGADAKPQDRHETSVNGLGRTRADVANAPRRKPPHLPPRGRPGGRGDNFTST